MHAARCLSAARWARRPGSSALAMGIPAEAAGDAGVADVVGGLPPDRVPDVPRVARPALVVDDRLVLLLGDANGDRGSDLLAAVLVLPGRARTRSTGGGEPVSHRRCPGTAA